MARRVLIRKKMAITNAILATPISICSQEYVGSSTEQFEVRKR